MFIQRQLNLAFCEWQALWRHGSKSGTKLAVVGVAERMTVLEGDLESETTQRHYEVGRINLVLEQLEKIAVGTHAGAMGLHKSRVDSTIRGLLFRMRQELRASAFHSWARATREAAEDDDIRSLEQLDEDVGELEAKFSAITSVFGGITTVVESAHSSHSPMTIATGRGAAGRLAARQRRRLAQKQQAEGGRAASPPPDEGTPPAPTLSPRSEHGD